MKEARRDAELLLLPVALPPCIETKTGSDVAVTEFPVGEGQGCPTLSTQERTWRLAFIESKGTVTEVERPTVVQRTKTEVVASEN